MAHISPRAASVGRIFALNFMGGRLYEASDYHFIGRGYRCDQLTNLPLRSLSVGQIQFGPTQTHFS